MSTVNDGKVLDYCKVPNGEYMLKLQQDEGLEGKTD